MNVGLQKKTLKGLFEPAYFTLPAVDDVISRFLQNTVLQFQNGLTVSMLAFFHHPKRSHHVGDVFYRWFVWDPKLNIDQLVLNDFAHSIKAEGKAYNLSYRNNTLVAKFMNAFEKKICARNDGIVSKIVLQKYDGGTEELTPLEDSGQKLWLITAPQQYKGFVETIKNSNNDMGATKWSIYCPIFVMKRFVGLFAIDSENEDTYVDISGKKKMLLSQVDLLELSLECLFKAYYSQLEQPPEKTRLTEEYWERCDEAFVFNPAFLAELRDSYLYDTIDKNYLLPRLRLVTYWDANGIKAINDTLSSHATGNEVIRSMGRWLHDGFMSLLEKANIDIDNAKFWVIRWGGDEFIILLATFEPLSGEEKNNLVKFMNHKQQCHIGIHISQQIDKFINELSNKTWRGGLELSQKSSAEVRRVLKKIGVAGGCSWCTEGNNTSGEYKDRREKAEKAMYVAKTLMKKKDLGNTAGICYEYSMQTEELFSRINLNDLFYDALEKAKNLHSE